MELLNKGKAKSVYKGEADLIIEFRDDLTAGDGAKHATMEGKGALNAEISARFFELLDEAGMETHFLGYEKPNRHLAKEVKIIPLEVICRNIAAGSILRRYPFEEGQEFTPPLVEFGFKSDEYHDPMLNDEVAIALGAVKDRGELNRMREMTLRVNDILRGFLAERGVILVDFKLEFGWDRDGNLLLADEVSPDTCRFWDAETKEVMDKDRFRRDMGDVLEYYREIRRRVYGD
ncbi:MAG: phosphoribosylaminoimidazolesuccinocarboxamide synthase [Candidatus Thermoplasmatota archaeon]|nr:phosphoribosylaminoimidazolesuccinocarboxamide synthase [Candidatus Thermoplasmatota archaeon]